MPRKYNYNYTNPFNWDETSSDRGKGSIHSLPFWVGFIAIVGFGGLFGVAYLTDVILPTALSTGDEGNYPDSFIAERAVDDLSALARIGQRVTGSYENEYLAVEFLLARINSIMSRAKLCQFIEVDVQTITGGYYLTDAVGYMNVYDKVQNVVVKLHGEYNDTDRSVLLNSHFDAVPVSPGGSDDGINVAIMLEVLRKLSQGDSRLSQNVIFLFNGAEETPMQASHGFVAHHKWANESRVLINLDAAGAGGKLQLFQTGPRKPWLVKYYGRVPHPAGSVAGEELFQSGLIPSDTDFRVFRDFGKTVGFDMAYTKDGYRYHTKYDGFANIPAGSYQHGGDNVLSLVKSLANAPEMTENVTFTEHSVYFDVLGWFFVYYTNQTAMIINFAAMALSIGIFAISLLDFRTGLSKSTLKFVIFTILAILFGWVIATVFALALAHLLDVLNKTMSWYGRLWFAFGLYMLPVIGLSGCFMTTTNHKNLSLGIRGQLQGHLLRMIWTVVLLAGTLLGVRSSFVIVILVLFNSLAFVIIHSFRIQHTVRTWQVIYLAAHVIPCTYTFDMMWTILSALAPMTGRLGAESNPEFYMAVIFLFFTLVATSALTVLSNLLRRPVWYYSGLLALFLVVFGLLFAPVGFPYVADDDAPRPQRHWVMHTERRFFDGSFSLTGSDSGILMVNMDRNSPGVLKPYVPHLEDAISIDSTGACDQYVFCALPMTHSKVLKKINRSTWIPAEAPEFPPNETLGLTVVSKEQVSSTLLKYHVKVTVKVQHSPSEPRTLLTMGEKRLILLLALVYKAQCQYYDSEPDLASPGRLGDRIRARVAESLRPVRIRLRDQRAELDGLGQRISQRVYDGLEPVRALELNSKMKNGVGGVTIVTVQPSGREFLTKDGRRFTCSARPDRSSGACAGALARFAVARSGPVTDWCYAGEYARVNDRVCLGFGGAALSVEAYGDRVDCHANDGSSPVLNISTEEYRKLCADVTKTVEYRYFPDLNDPGHVEIPNANRYVKCENRDGDSCVFREDNQLLGFYGGTVIVNSNTA